MAPTPMPLAHGLLAVLVALIWGLSFTVIKLGVGAMPPLVLSALRFAFAAFPAVFFIPRPAVPWRFLAGFGIALGVVKFGLLFSAIALGMPAGLASLVMQAQVFFTILFAAALMRERPARHQIIGGAVGCLGLVLIAWPRLGEGEAVPFLMTVAAAATWGVANIIAKRAGRIDMLGFVVWASLFAPLPLLALSLAIDGPHRVSEALLAMDLTAVGAVAYLAYPTTVFAFAVWAFLLSRHSAAAVTPFALLVPVTGFAGAALFLGESVSALEAVGGGVVIAGLAVNVFGLRLARRFWPAPFPSGG